MHRTVRLVLALVLLAAVPPAQSEGESLMNVRYVTTKSLADLYRYTAVYKGAASSTRSRAVRKLVFSDSRCTALGQGQYANSMEAYQHFLYYGNTPETGISSLTVFGDAGRSAANGGQWCMSEHTWATNGANQCTAANVPYGMEGVYPFLSNLATLTSTFQLQHKADSIEPSVLFVPAATYFSRASIRFEIFVPRLAGNHTVIAWTEGTRSAPGVSYFPAVTASGTIDTAAATSVQGDVVSCNGVEGPVRSYLLPVFDWGSGATSPTDDSHYANLVFGSNSGATNLEFIGVLVRAANTAGIGMTYCGAAGKTMSDPATDTPGMAPSINAYGPDIVSVRFGINDLANGVSAATYQTNTQAFVDWIQANIIGSDGVNPPLIELETPYTKTALTAPQQAQLALYPAAQAAVAAATSGVMAEDILSATNAMGFNAAVHTFDGTHLTQDGAAVVAAARAMIEANVTTPSMKSRRWRRRGVARAR